jgi:membrane protease YdiL (CAAX protease family)
MQTPNRHLIIYLGLVLILTTTLLLIASKTGSELAGALSQATPAFAMLAVAFFQFGRKAPAQLGLTKFGHVGWYLFALLVPGVIIAASFALSYSLGFAQFLNIGTRSPSPAELLWICGNVGKHFLLAIFVSLPLPLIWAAGEELGWRGYMQPLLMKKHGYAIGCLVSGLIWAAYHAIFIMTGTYFDGGNVVIQTICLTILCVILSFIMGAIRLRTASVYPAILFHAEINVAQLYFGSWIFKFNRPEGVYLSGEAGAFNIGLWLLALAAILISTRPRSEHLE